MKIKSYAFYRAECVFWRRKTNSEIVRDMDDMLRYDGAFCDPQDPHLIAVPTYQGQLKHGATEARWRSFSIKLYPLVEPPESWLRAAASWVTAEHPRGISIAPLKLYTLAEVLAATNSYDLK